MICFRLTSFMLQKKESKLFTVFIERLIHRKKQTNTGKKVYDSRDHTAQLAPCVGTPCPTSSAGASAGTSTWYTWRGAHILVSLGGIPFAC